MQLPGLVLNTVTITIADLFAKGEKRVVHVYGVPWCVYGSPAAFYSPSTALFTASYSPLQPSTQHELTPAFRLSPLLLSTLQRSSLPLLFDKSICKSLLCAHALEADPPC